MEPQRSLRAVFGDLAGDESARPPEDDGPGDLGDLLAAMGYPGLPDSLIAEAITSYADTAPAEVAEHLAPFVLANSPVPVDDPQEELDSAQALDQIGPLDPLDLLVTAPTSLAADDHLADSGADPDDDLFVDPAPAVDETSATINLDFGEGDVATDAPAVAHAEEADGVDAADDEEEAADAFAAEDADDASLLDAVAQPQPDDATDDVGDDAADNLADNATDDEIPDF
jgi:hypothetical protein